MYQSRSYPSVPIEAIHALMDEQFHVKVIAVDENGYPCVSLLPFVRLSGENGQPDVFELHMVQADRTFQALERSRKASLLFDDPLAFSPHEWVTPLYAGMATLHFRAVNVQADVETSTDPVVVAAFLARLLKRYEPDATYHQVRVGGVYDKDLAHLGAVRLTTVRHEAKWKLAQNRSESQRAELVAHLEQRGRPLDARAAQVIAENRVR
jgi:predicted FMN-binding regulatory protein PaiB